MNNKVVLGISGGIDSAVSALLLKLKGMEVYALYFDIKKNSDLSDAKAAEEICKQLDINYHYVNLSERFEKVIIEPFCLSYMGGCTPSPCVWCNPFIKWWALKEYADEIGADYLSTGHYARIEKVDDIYYVKKAVNLQKDQSYMLSMLGQDILSRVIFPLGEFKTKYAVRLFAKEHNLIVPENLKESQDICFINTNYKNFLAQRGYSGKAGNFVDENGAVLGSHKSCSDFTIGQGKGFGMGFNKKVYVKSIDSNTGNITICEDSSLYTNSISISIQNFAKYGMIDYLPKEYEGKPYITKIRYGAKGDLATLSSVNCEQGIAVLNFEEPQRAPAFGQFAVIYEDDRVIGCGLIS